MTPRLEASLGRPFVYETRRLTLRLPAAAAETSPRLFIGANGAIVGRAPECRPDWVRIDVSLGSERIGDVGLLFTGWSDVEIGYRVALEHRRNGYATEALEALLLLAWSAFDLPALEAEAAADNVPSHRTLARLGFTALGSAGERWSERRRAYINYLRFRLERPVARVRS